MRHAPVVTPESPGLTVTIEPSRSLDPERRELSWVGSSVRKGSWGTSQETARGAESEHWPAVNGPRSALAGGRSRVERRVLDISDVETNPTHSVKLSNKGRYGVGALFAIVFYNAGRATQVKDIASREGIPPRFLEQIFQDLKRAGIVASKRGPQGGYTLARPPAEIRLGDIVRALEGPIALGEPKSDLRSKRKAGADTKRVTESVLLDLSRRVEACFDAVSLADLCTRAEELGLTRPSAQRIVYSI